jgi:hypothetical protein
MLHNDPQILGATVQNSNNNKIRDMRTPELELLRNDLLNDDDTHTGECEYNIILLYCQTGITHYFVLCDIVTGVQGSLEH